MRLTVPPYRGWYVGRRTVVAVNESGFAPESGQLRGLPAGANRHVVSLHYRPRTG